MKNIFWVIAIVGGLMMAAAVQAKQIGEVAVPDTAAVSGQTLILNGAGFRTKFVFDIYVGALYTEKKVSSRNELMALEGPNRVLMHFVYGEVDKEKLVDAWNEGFEENNSEEKLQSLQTRIDRFNSFFTTLEKGDVVVLDYIPGKGTQVTIKGQTKGVIEGRDFNQALLDIWVGDEPADEDLKDAMLGNE